MSTLEDKILDGPRIHYCDADDDDRRDDDEGGGSSEELRGNVSDLFTRPSETERPSGIPGYGCSINTGPKGVIEDHRKQNSSTEDQEFEDLMNDDSYIRELIARRLAENNCVPSFGQVHRLETGEQLLDAIDKENPRVLVIVHLYTRHSRSCGRLNRCLDELANDLKNLKFVTLDASVTNLSANFKQNGVPAILAYRAGELIKSLVQLDDLLDQDFEADQVRELLIDNNLIN